MMFRRFLSRIDLLALALAGIMLTSALFSIEAAGWVDDLPHPALNGLGAMLLAGTLSILGLRWYLAHLSALPIGLVAIAWQVMPILAGKSWIDRLVDLLTRMNAWGYAARTGGISTDLLPFHLLLLGFAWIGGFALGWSVCRGRRPWLSIALAGVALLLNLNYAPARLGIFFLVYIMAALLLVVRLNQSYDPVVGKTAGSGQLFAFSAVLAFSLSLVVWFVPTPRESTDLLNVWYRVNTPWQDGLGQMNRLFAFLVSRERPGPGDFDKALVIRGTSNLSDEPVMLVESTAPRYWRGLSYDYYTGQGWLVQDQSPVRLPGPATDMQSTIAQYQSTTEVTQTITILSPKNGLVFAAGQPQKLIDLTVNLGTTRREPATLSTSALSRNETVPPDLRPYAGALRESLQGVGSRWDNERVLRTINSRLPQGVRVTEVARADDGSIAGVQAVTRFPADVTAMYSSSPLQIGQKYTVVSAVSDASPDQLRAAGEDYPSWVTERYLQLPSTLPQRVRDLSQRLTESGRTPYDRAQTIEAYLRTFTYSTNLPMPPGNMDRVDYLLFTLRKGYSAYFSTTMVVMLRSIGVPARVVTGYATGAIDSERGAHLVKESNAHGWVEVFFPRYGWIEFEPTPSLPPLARATSDAGEDVSDQDLLLNMPNEPDGSLPVPITEEASVSSQENPSRWPGWGWGVFLPVLAAVAWLAWRRHWATIDASVAVYGKMSLIASLTQLGPRSSQTPREYGEVLKKALPRQRKGIEVILSNYERVRYGGRASTPDESSELLQFWHSLRADLLRRICLPRRDKKDC